LAFLSNESKEKLLAVMLLVEMPVVGPEKYDAIQKELGLYKEGAMWPKGILSHVAGATPGGWLVVNVWESEAAFGKFQQAQANRPSRRWVGCPSHG
jgi:hypothetical protein